MMYDNTETLKSERVKRKSYEGHYSEYGLFLQIDSIVSEINNGTILSKITYLSLMR